MSLPVELRRKHCPNLQCTGFWNCCFGETILRFRGVEEEGKKGERTCWFMLALRGHVSVLSFICFCTRPPSQVTHTAGTMFRSFI